MKVPFENWDPIFVYVNTCQLVPKLWEEWEGTLGLSNELPPYQKLHDFLTGKIRTWENSSICTLSRPPSPKGEQKRNSSSKPPSKSGTARSSLNSFRATSNSSPSTLQVYYTPREVTNELGICQLCHEKYFVLFCKIFKDASVVQRRNLVQEHRICWNSLGHHRLQDCHTEDRCHHCHKKYHTAIHEDTKTQPPSATTTDKPGTK